MAAIDVAQVVADVSGVGMASVASVGVACLLVGVAVKAFTWLRAFLGGGAMTARQVAQMREDMGLRALQDTDRVHAGEGYFHTITVNGVARDVFIEGKRGGDDEPYDHSRDVSYTGAR